MWTMPSSMPACTSELGLLAVPLASRGCLLRCVCEARQDFVCFHCLTFCLEQRRETDAMLAAIFYRRRVRYGFFLAVFISKSGEKADSGWIGDKFLMSKYYVLWVRFSVHVVRSKLPNTSPRPSGRVRHTPTAPPLSDPTFPTPLRAKLKFKQ